MQRSTHSIHRREFIGAASALTVLPGRVLGGRGQTPPSEKVRLAMVGAGPQALRTLTRWLPRPELLFTCVCDPNRDSADYVDWSRHGLRDTIRRFLEDSDWGEHDEGIRAGREVARAVVNRYYERAGLPADCRAYADFREMLDAEDDLDGVVIITPDHLHAVIAQAAMESGRHVIAHKPVSNVLHEVRRVVETAQNSSLVTHLLAWNDHPSLYRIRAWLEAGVIGPVREVHNWSNRPVWPQGWLEYPREPRPVPEDLDWKLWQGPEPDRPYHPRLTHALYRGWHAYGSGCLGDMGNYSLWRVYRILDLSWPERVEATPSTHAEVVDGVSRWRRSDVAFPHASTIRFHHPARGDRPAVDIWWYDGGMRPPTPPELLSAGQQLEPEGMLFVGDEGKILAGFRGEEPRLLPEKLTQEAEEEIEVDLSELGDGTEEWINALKQGRESRGSFPRVQALAEATCLGNLALRVAHPLDWDPQAMRVTNHEAANRHLRREYRPGWEL